jgi:hypothetical protein
MCVIPFTSVVRKHVFSSFFLFFMMMIGTFWKIRNYFIIFIIVVCMC